MALYISYEKQSRLQNLLDSVFVTTAREIMCCECVDMASFKAIKILHVACVCIRGFLCK